MWACPSTIKHTQLKIHMVPGTKVGDTYITFLQRSRMRVSPIEPAFFPNNAHFTCASRRCILSTSFTAGPTFLQFNKLPRFPRDPIKSINTLSIYPDSSRIYRKNTYRCITSFSCLQCVVLWLECPVHQGCPFHGVRYTSNKECEK